MTPLVHKRGPHWPASLLGFHKLAGVLHDRHPLDRHREGPAHKFGLELETEVTKEVGERRPTKRTKGGCVIERYHGLGDNAGDDGVKVMSMLPPPSIARLIEHLQLVGSRKHSS